MLPIILNPSPELNILFKHFQKITYQSEDVCALGVTHDVCDTIRVAIINYATMLHDHLRKIGEKKMRKYKMTQNTLVLSQP